MLLTPAHREEHSGCARGRGLAINNGGPIGEDKVSACGKGALSSVGAAVAAMVPAV